MTRQTLVELSATIQQASALTRALHQRIDVINKRLRAGDMGAQQDLNRILVSMQVALSFYDAEKSVAA